MSPDVSERAFEQALECRLLRHGQDNRPGDAKTFRETARPYGERPPGGYGRRKPEDYDRALCLLPRIIMEATPEGDFFVRSGPGTVKLSSESVASTLRPASGQHGEERRNPMHPRKGLAKKPMKIAVACGARGSLVSRSATSRHRESEV